MGSLEARYRPAGAADDTAKRRTQKSKSFKEVEKFDVFVLEKSSGCKFRSLQLLLFAIMSAAFLTLLYTPSVYEHQLQSNSRFVNVGWIWDKTIPDPRYVSSMGVQWEDVYKTIENLNGGEQKLKVGLLNFNSTEFGSWTQLLPDSEFSIIRLEHAKESITWQTLYPEWIDEEEETDIPSCPSLPEPNFPGGTHFDVIAVKLPCTRVGGWSRDVARLHLQLSAAKLAVTSARARLYSVDRRREAYATILHSASEYVCGAIAAAQSIRQAGSTRDFVILVDDTISDHHRKGLESAGWKVRIIERIRNPKAERDAYNEWNYSKFRLWQLTDYDKIIFIDADLLILRNIDFLFAMPEITATGNNATLFNSGVMVIEPSNCTFQLLMNHINEITSYNGGDQGYLNEIFTWWHRIPKHMNFLKHFWEGDEDAVKAKKTQLFGADPPALYVLHYLGRKPWLCFRDYDCNWNVPILREFASDIAHTRWWKVHDKMPKKLQSYCLLRSRLKAGLEWERRQAEKANFIDGHWKRNITDKRLKICFEKFCFWESMLWHWGEAPNSTKKISTPALPTATLSSS
ncbi:unnamed protein product [Alopecurus aequalis]